jgi:hypothetical protein|tara:strand:- start:138 stop:344 length:207 start_codon:yes stop_codon:yes gene_type:complete
MDSLEFVQSDKMIEELHKRFDTFVLLANANRTDDVDDLTLCFGGAYHSILGLLEVGRIAVDSGGLENG